MNRDDLDSICDKCGEACSSNEKNLVSAGEWAGIEVCNECYAALPAEDKPDMA